MSVKNVYLKKKIEGVIYDIYPHTEASLVSYTRNEGEEVAEVTTVESELSRIAGLFADYMTSTQVETRVTQLYNQIMGLTGEEGETINAAYDTLKEVADYLAAHGSVVSGFTSDISALQTTVGDASSGLVKDVADLETTVGDASSGLVKDVADLETTVGDASSGLVKRVSDLETSASSGSGVSVVSDITAAEASDNILYIVLDNDDDEPGTEEP